MPAPSLTDVAHTVAAFAAVLLLAWLGRAAFRAVRQPPVIGEIAAGLVLGPIVVALAGHDLLDTLLPAHVLAVLRHLGHAGLMLFLLGIAHELRSRGSATGNRAVVWVAAASFLPALAAGAAVALWTDRSGGAALRGDAPLSSFVLLLAVAFAVTAVPVLARILADRGMTATVAGRLSLQAAVVMDVPAWLLLAVAVGGSGGDLIVPSAVLAACVAAVLLVRPLLAAGPAGAFCARSPTATAVLLAAATLVVASTTEHLGLTSLFGAFAVGFMVPAGSARAPWSVPISRVARVGGRLMPVFFLVTGVTIVSGPLGGMPWSVMAAVTLLAIAVKIAGGYLGGRLGGESHGNGLRLAALMNTRGLTEIVVLQAGFSAGILAAPLFAALLGMTLITTCLTAPLLSLIDRVAGRPEDAVARPLVAQARGARSNPGRE